MKFATTLGNRTEIVDISGGSGRFRVAIGDRIWEVDARRTSQGIASLLIDGISYVLDVREEEGKTLVDVAGERYEIRVEEEAPHVIRTRGRADRHEGGQILKAPMPGRVTHVAVRIGDAVEPGTPLLVIEAMKMENEFTAKAAGRVTDVRVEAGRAVNAGDVLVIIQ